MTTCYDGNGNVIGLVGYATGNILCKNEYDPYGKLIRTSGNTPLAASNPFLFPSKFLDRETGLSYYGYRYCSAEKGRWLNRHPICQGSSENFYDVTVPAIMRRGFALERKSGRRITTPLLDE